jgi:hypothetical protein
MPTVLINSGDLDKRDTQQEQALAQMGSTYDQQGFLQVTGTGEALTNVAFDFPFVEKPIFTWGAEMCDGSGVVIGSFPTITVVVTAWITIIVPGNSIGLLAASGVVYHGAVLAMVITGTPNQSMWIHYDFNGSALAFPGADSGSAISNGLGSA